MPKGFSTKTENFHHFRVIFGTGISGIRIFYVKYFQLVIKITGGGVRYFLF